MKGCDPLCQRLLYNKPDRWERDKNNRRGRLNVKGEVSELQNNDFFPECDVQAKPAIELTLAVVDGSPELRRKIAVRKLQWFCYKWLGSRSEAELFSSDSVDTLDGVIDLVVTLGDVEP